MGEETVVELTGGLAHAQSFVQSPVSPLSDPTHGWYSQFEGVQLGVFREYEVETSDSGSFRTGFCLVTIGGAQVVRARLDWASDGKTFEGRMPIPDQTILVIGFVRGQSRAYAEAQVIGWATRRLSDGKGGPTIGVDTIFQTANPGDYINRTRFNPGGGQAGQKTDHTTLLVISAMDGSVQLTIDEQSANPVKVTIKPDGTVTLDKIGTLTANAQHVTVNCPDINLGDGNGNPLIRTSDLPQHIDPATGAVVTAFGYTSNSAKVKAS